MTLKYTVVALEIRILSKQFGFVSEKLVRGTYLQTFKNRIFQFLDILNLCTSETLYPKF